MCGQCPASKSWGDLAAAKGRRRLHLEPEVHGISWTAGRNSCHNHQRLHCATSICLPDSPRGNKKRPPAYDGGRLLTFGAYHGELLPEVAQELKSNIWVRVPTYDVDTGNNIVRRWAE